MTGKPQRYAIVGMGYRKEVGAQGIVDQVAHHAEVELITEPSNQYDPNAVQVWIDGVHVGFVPKTQNAVLAKFIRDKGDITERGMAMDEAIAPRHIKARIHRGNSPVPLVEIA